MSEAIILALIGSSVGIAGAAVQGAVALLSARRAEADVDEVRDVLGLTLAYIAALRDHIATGQPPPPPDPPSELQAALLARSAARRH